jgi:hypothetical protein
MTINNNVTILSICDTYQTQLPFGVVNDIKETINAGEIVIAFQELCNYLHEYSIEISQDIFIKIQLMGKDLVMDESDWIFLKPLINDLEK